MKYRPLTFSSVAALAALLCTSAPGFAQSILKTAGNYSVLASQAITVAGTGFTITNGNVGLFPSATSNITGFPPGTVSGTTLLGTAAAIIVTGGATQQAQADLQVAATGLAAMAPNANHSNVDMANLGPLPPGVYKWDAAAGLTGALVLDAQGHNNVYWVFQFGTGLTTAANSSVTLINPGSNGGSDDGIFWNAETGAIVIGDNNTIRGNYIAFTSVSFTGSTNLLGGGGARFLALNAKVSFAGPGAINALGGPGGSDWTGGLKLSGGSVVATAGSGSSARLINISARAQIGTGANILIPGFVISGSGEETLLIRADGPSLSQFSVPGVLAKPSVSVFNSAGVAIASNTGWETSSNPAQITSVSAQVGAFSLTPGSADSALIISLPAGAYTVQVSGVNNTTGVALAEVYEVSSTGTRLINISTRAQVGTGASIIIPGFVISGSGTEQLLVRADGPGLTQFSVTGVLAQPKLSVFDNAGNVIASNTGWGTSSNAAQITSVGASVGAFALTPGSADSAQIVNLSEGAYTMQVSGVNNTTGVALAEVYEGP